MFAKRKSFGVNMGMLRYATAQAFEVLEQDGMVVEFIKNGKKIAFGISPKDFRLFEAMLEILTEDQQVQVRTKAFERMKSESMKNKWD